MMKILNLREEIVSNRKIPPPIDSVLSMAVFSVAVLVCGYGIYATNILPAQACKAVNYGYAYAGVDAVKARNYFNRAFSLPFNFDIIETANRYGEFTIGAAQGQSSLGKEEGLNLLKKTSGFVYDLAGQISNSPVLWQQAANLYLNQSYLTASPLDIKAKIAIEKAKDLAPQRVEYKTVMMQIASFEGNRQLTQKLAEEIVVTNPSLDYQWQLAAVYYQLGKNEQALEMHENLLQKEYSFRSFSHVAWIIEHYERLKNFEKAATWYEVAVKFNPQDVNFYIGMAETYWQAGYKDKAREFAEKILKIDPKQSENLKEIIKAN